jgi:hypothetical protein
MTSSRIKWTCDIYPLGDDKLLQTFSKKSEEKRPIERPRLRWVGYVTRSSERN